MLSFMLLLSMLGNATAAPEPLTESALWQVIRETYPDVLERMNPDFDPYVKLSDEYAVIAFEVEPVDAHKLPWFYYHLAVFQFEGRELVSAVELEKGPEGPSTLIATDLISGAVTREVIRCQKAVSPLPELQSGIESQPPEMCQVCARYETGGGYIDDTCLWLCTAGCALLSGPAAAACILACGGLCWVPSWSICVEWEWVECGYPE
ncbi:hypothetical protein [Symbiobacterium terraclitae]|uniref:hypothetical protein n=1 Tax=Symbiobacterium terraclitae TaxID=557451 RepID=UPI0035B50323